MLHCRYCKSLVPKLAVGTSALEQIARALAEGSHTLACHEVMFAAQCSETAAHQWISHLCSCEASQPLTADDEKVLRLVSEAFELVEKPDHFTDFTHCEECRDHDVTLRAKTRETISRQDLGTDGWDPISYSSAEGMGYLFPALAKSALLPYHWVWRDHEWYGRQLLWHLSYDGLHNKFLVWCSPAQRTAVAALLRHLLETRAQDISAHVLDSEFVAALDLWCVD